MLIKNTGVKTIGFGSFVLLPGETATLPEGYSMKHPVVQFYFRKGFLTAVDETAVIEQRASDEKAKQEADELARKIKALSALKLEELRSLATELGVTFEDSDTKDIFKQKITEKYQAD